jgi:hypothetical protein
VTPDRRFRPEPMTAQEAIDWLKTHRYVWYQVPMDLSPVKLHCSSKLKLWKRDASRFQVSLEMPYQFGCGNRPEVIRLDNSHLDRLRLPFPLWHHGVKATVAHVDYVGKKHVICLSQSNGYHLNMPDLRSAINHARGKAMELTARYGKRVRVLVPAREPISGERQF